MLFRGRSPSIAGEAHQLEDGRWTGSRFRTEPRRRHPLNQSFGHTLPKTLCRFLRYPIGKNVKLSKFTMATETKLLRLALNAYEAASEPELWPGFLKRYAETVSADASFLQIHNLAGHISTIVDGFGISSPLKQSYNEHYSKLNVWRDRGRALYRAGRVNLDPEQCPRSVLERSEYYHDCLKRFGIAHSMAAVIAREGDYAPTLTSLRGPGKHPFGESEREVGRFLMPHLTRAWAIAPWKPCTMPSVNCVACACYGSANSAILNSACRHQR